MSETKYCPHCHQPYTMHVILGLRPNTVRARLYEIVKKAGPTGLSSDKLFTQLYGYGGPLSGLKTLQVHVWFLNRILEPKNQIIRSRRIKGTHSVAYYLVEMQ